MKTPRRSWKATILLGLLWGSQACEGPEGRATPEATARDTVFASLMASEDARGRSEDGLAPLLAGVDSDDPEVQAMAVRGLGRLEDPGHIPIIAAALSSGSADTRAEAVNALGQAVYRTEGDDVAGILLEHLGRETDPMVRGVVGRTLGRLRYAEAANVDLADQALLALTHSELGDAPLPSLTGAVMGFESMARRNRNRGLPDQSRERLRELTSFGVPTDPAAHAAGSELESARVRRAALLALTASGGIGEDVLRAALSDPDPDVRRLALSALPRSFVADHFLQQLRLALADPVARVRAQAVAVIGSIGDSEASCEALFEASLDSHPQVALTALDLLDEPCPDMNQQKAILTGFIQAEEAASESRWHRGAHALLALAGVSPADASRHLPGLADHPSPFARAHAARVAATLRNADVLERLTRDADPNVRTAATQGLFRHRGHGVDSVVIAQLTQDDPQLLLTAARLLEGTPGPTATVTPLLDALHRLTATGMETTRDPRVAILNRLGEVGSPETAPALEPYLSDFDPVVAERTAELLTAWTGETAQATPSSPTPTPLPSPSEVDRLSESTVVLEMEGSGEIHIRLLAHLAPTNAARFARLARSGYFDGLTFHRVAWNFVLQGGSPNANEMSGDGPFTRDEIGLQANWRGTVGVSTRGRDTGDGQIFINLVDNLRLDHNYTIVGEVVDGMSVVDQVVEGQRIVRARLETW